MILLAMAVLLVTISVAPAWCQTAQITGKIIDKAGKPLADAQIFYTSLTNNKSFKVKTDKNGEFVQLNVPYDTYQIEVVSPDGQSLFKQKATVSSDPKGQRMVLDLSSETSSGEPALSKEQIEAMKEQNERLAAENALITKYQTAVHDKNWLDAESIAGQLVAIDPKRWEYQKSLGDAQTNLGKFDDAVATYEKGILLAQNDATADPAKTKIAISQMLTMEGNTYLKQKKYTEATAVFSRAAEMSPNPGTAYFNLCAVQYNQGMVEGALAACDKAIAADPTKADAYFIKGSLLVADSKSDAQGRFIAPPGTVEALNKYLELAPEGAHASDVKEMLQLLGAKIETTYKGKQK